LNQVAPAERVIGEIRNESSESSVSSKVKTIKVCIRQHLIGRKQNGLFLEGSEAA
jgi:hypothetical protein